MPPEPPSGVMPAASQTIATPSKISLFVSKSTWGLSAAVLQPKTSQLDSVTWLFYPKTDAVY